MSPPYKAYFVIGATPAGMFSTFHMRYGNKIGTNIPAHPVGNAGTI